MKNKAFLFLLLSVLFICGCKKDSDSDGTSVPAAGSSRSITVDVTWHKAILVPSVGNWALWSMAKFPVDNNAKSYKVRLFGFNGTASNALEGKTYAWNAGTLPPTPYNIFPETKDIKDGHYYMAFDRTWCGGACPESTTDQWLANLKKGYGAPKAEVTYQY
jgi:hypothetical protein